MSISAGVAGNAAAEATAVWTAGLDLTDLTKIAAADLDILKVERENAEDAEGEAFNPAIAAASGAAATALQCGKIKYSLFFLPVWLWGLRLTRVFFHNRNKVLKLTGFAQILEIELAQATASGDDTTAISAKLADTNKKLATNIATVSFLFLVAYE